MKYTSKNLFISEKEELKGFLSQESFASIMVEDELSKSALILTDKRLYQVGKLYRSSFPRLTGGFRSNNGRKIVDLEDISGTTSLVVSKPLPGIFVILFGLIAILLGLLTDVRQSMFIMLAAGTVISGSGIFWALKRNRRYLIIHYAGGDVIQPVKFATDSEISLFQSMILVFKERAVTGIVESKICQYCGEKIQFAAKVCRYCGHDQDDKPLDQMPELTRHIK